jgi:hypothetical protein
LTSDDFSQERPTEAKIQPIQGQGRIITENEERLRQAILDNEALERLYDQKQEDQMKINQKH